jgi:hypothetical protein
MNAGSGRGKPRPLLKKIGWVPMVSNGWLRQLKKIRHRNFEREY